MMTLDWAELKRIWLANNAMAVIPPHIRIPMLPRVLNDFNKRADDPDVTTRELAEILERDAGFSCELLRYVNSCAFGMRRKINTCQHAISLLGIRTAKLYLATTAVKQALMSSESKLVNLQVFWCNNLERAILARQLARLIKADGELAFSASMLADCLLPLLTSELLPKYLGFFQRDEKTPVYSLVEYERRQFGWDHARAAANILAAWEFPDDLVCCVFGHHFTPADIVRNQLEHSVIEAVATAGLMPDAFRQSPHGLESLAKLEQTWPNFKLLEIADKVEQEFKATSDGVADNHISFKRRCEKFLAAAGN